MWQKRREEGKETIHISAASLKVWALIMLEESE